MGGGVCREACFWDGSGFLFQGRKNIQNLTANLGSPTAIEARHRGPFGDPFLGPKIGTKNCKKVNQKLGKNQTRGDPGIQRK